MKTLSKLFILTLSLGVLSAFGPCDKNSGADADSKPGLVIVNVLDKELFNSKRIVNSICVPLGELEAYALKYWDKDTTHVVIHCANYMCTASADGVRMLDKLGFKNVWAYEGGTAEWVQTFKNDYPQYIQGSGSDAYLAQYQKPEGYQEPEDIKIISTDELIKKMKEFKLL